MPIRSHDFVINGRNIALLPETAITAAVTGSLGTVFDNLAGMKYVGAIAVFSYTSGGTTARFWLQTSFDEGTTYTDIASWYFTTSDAEKFHCVKSPIAVAANQSVQDSELASNSILDGVLGDRLRVKYTTTGTYVATTIKIDCVCKG